MKKILLSFAIAFVAISCSSDDEPALPKERTQYEVDFTISDAELKAEAIKQDENNGELCFLEGDKMGNGGLFIYYKKNYTEVDAYDACCPFHWGDDDKRIILEFDYQTGHGTCDVCRSSFDLTNGKGTASYGLAFEKNLSLVKYEVKRPIIEGIYSIVFSNPNYKK